MTFLLTFMWTVGGASVLYLAWRFVRGCIHFYSTQRPNRYTRKARRWPSEGQTHRSYWSGCKRVGVE